MTEYGQGPTLRQRVASHLGWTEEETRQVGIRNLRELVRCHKLRAHLSDLIISGRYIYEKEFS